MNILSSTQVLACHYFYALSVCPSVRPSVDLRTLFVYFTLISTWVVSKRTYYRYRQNVIAHMLWACEWVCELYLVSDSAGVKTTVELVRIPAKSHARMSSNSA